MLLTEPVESINKQLKEQFGIDTLTGQTIWRIVWSEDQFEMRYGTYDDFSDGGIFLRTVSEVRQAPKYRQWIKEKFVLERLVVIPFMNATDLPESKVSYEPLWVFEDKYGNYLPPKFEAAKFIIDTVYAVQYSDHTLQRYKDPIQSHEDEIDAKNDRVNRIAAELYGDETDVSDALSRKEGIIVPSNFSNQN